MFAILGAMALITFAMGIFLIIVAKSKGITVRQLLVLFKFKMGERGPACTCCGFSKAAHIDPSYEFDFDKYPCEHFVKP